MKGIAEECSNYHTIAVISHTSKAMFKILQARLQQYMNLELPDVQAGFRKGSLFLFEKYTTIISPFFTLSKIIVSDLFDKWTTSLFESSRHK